ncbi:GntR family transcriptional regulator [Streptomyces halobius]|uniref:GntR family transcriptional regulator n=1 Tax=Streptomyces halobius TaxID=2879846 RepID=UPI00200C6CC1|nr:GntR family transcriptional regulator [Streptomyces halobius]
MQISESLRQKIEKGKISEALPSEAELMRTYGVGRSTVGRALKVLKADGVIESVQGAGWYVAGTGDRRPLVEKVLDLLRAEGAKVGDTFPSESQLCDTFEVSRTAVRADTTGIPASELASLTAPLAKRTCLERLSHDAALWGREVNDERYAMVVQGVAS